MSALDSFSRLRRFAQRARFASLSLAALLSLNPLLVQAQSGQTINVANGDVAGFITAIQTLNAGGGGTIDLASGGTYSVTAPSDWWYGPNAFPAIASAIIINGNGATISRASGSPKFRFFYVSGGFSTLPAGSLTLNNLTLTGGLAQGGNGGNSGYDAGTGGGGGGMGGAIYNQGTTNLSSVAFTSNKAQGGNSGQVCPSQYGGTCGGPSGGGGMGGNGGDFSVGSETGAGGGFRYSGSGQTGGSFLGNEGGSPSTGGASSYGGNGGAGGDGGGGGGGYAAGANGASGAGTQLGGAGAYAAGEGGGTSYPNSNGCKSGGGGAFGGGGGVDADGSGCAGGYAGYGGGGGIGGGGGVGAYGPGNGGFGGGGAGQQDCTCGGAGPYGCGHGAGGFGGGGGACVIFYSNDVEPSGGFAGGAAGEPVSGDYEGGGGAGFGGAVFNQLGLVIALDTVFTSNSAAGGSGGNSGSGLGGAILNLNGTVLLDSVTYSGNTASTSSGGNVFYNLSHNGGNTTSSQTSTATLQEANTALSTTNGDLITNQVNGTASTVSTETAMVLASPATINFGNEYLGWTTSSQTITVTSAGTSPLSIFGISLSSGGQFSIVSDNCPSTLTAGSTCQVTVTFNPTAAGLDITQLTINSLSLINSGLTVQLTGTGVVPPTTTMLAFGTAPPAASWLGSTVGTLTVIEQTSGGTQNPAGQDLITLNITGPNSYSSTYTANASAGLATFNLGSLVFPATGSYSFQATAGTGVTSANASETIIATSTSFGSGANVGTPSAGQAVSLIFPSGGTLNSISVLTQGASGLDFAAVSGGSCAAGTTYAALQTCTVNVDFDPLESGQRTGAVELLDSSGDILATSFVSGIGEGPQVAYGPASQTSVTSGLNAPAGVAADASGNLYIADSSNQRALKLPWTGSGYGTAVPLGTGLDFPFGIAVDGSGNVYIADSDHSRILKLAWNGTSYAAQTTVGSGWSYPYNLVVDGAGNLIVADTYNSRVVKLPWTGSGYGSGTTIGSGFDHPSGVAVDGNGNVYVADSYNQRVMEVPWNGTSYGTAYQIGGFYYDPEGVAVDANGNVYITDIGNAAAYKLPWNGTSFGAQTSIASGLSAPEGVYADAVGNVYIADRGKSSVFKIDMADAPSFSFPTSTNDGTIDTTDGPKTANIFNIGNQPLTFTTPSSGSNPSYPANFPVNTADSNLCASGTPLAQGSSCDISMNFDPTSGGANTGSVVITDNALNVSNARQTIADSGTGISTAVNTTTSLASTLNPSTYGQSVAVVATVTAQNSPVSQGTVQFTLDGAVVQGGFAVALNGSGQASAILTGMTVGSHSVIATYNPSNPNTYSSSASPALTQTVNQASQAITFTPPTSPVIYPGTSPITLSATGGASGSPVTFSILSGPGSLSGTNNSLLTVTGTGTIVIAANQAGNTNYLAAAQVMQSVIVNAPAAATLVSPAPNTTLTGSSVVFTWNTSTGATGYALWVGTTGVGSHNLLQGGVHTTTSATVSNLPTNGATVYVRLYTSFNGTLLSNDYTFTAAAFQAAITSPANGSTLTGPSATFTWSTVTGATGYALWLGTTGAGSHDLLQGGVHTTTSYTITTLPTNGVTIYARLYTSLNGTLTSVDTTYTAAAQAIMTTPAPASTLTGSSVSFTWSPGSGTGTALWIGTTGAGSHDLMQGGVHTTTSATLTTLPLNGATIYVRLYTSFNGTLLPTDYTYTAATPAAITSPTAASTLGGSSVTFTWTPGSGTGTALWIGTTGAGSHDLMQGGVHTTTSQTISTLPLNGATIYVRLYTSFNGTLVPADYQYTAATQSTMVSPAPNSILPGSSVTFTWTAGSGQGNALWMGTTGVGSHDLSQGGVHPVTSLTVNNIPIAGQPIYVRLYTSFNGTLVSNDYTYTAQ